MKKISFIMLVLLVLCFSVQGKDKQTKEQQKTVVPIKSLLKQARSAIKEKKNQTQRETELEEACKREGLSNEQLSEIRYTQSQLNVSLNDAENLKAYLKQKYDTAQFFNSLQKACVYALQCDSTDTLPHSKGKLKPLYRTKNRDLLLLYRPNLFAGGRFYLRKNNFVQALPFLTTYIDMVDEDLLKDRAEIQGDTLLPKAFFYAVVAAYNSHQPKVVLKYIDFAIAGVGQKERPDLQEYKVRCLEMVGDSTQRIEELKTGCERYPTHDYFFSELIEYYDSTKNYSEGQQLANHMLSDIQDIPLYWYAKSLLYLHEEKWEQCIEMSDSVLVRNTVHTDALYNKGISYINMAMDYAETACYDVKKAKCRKDRLRIQNYYRMAQAPFEKLRSLLPDDKQKWAPALYRIYLNLNMGKEFAEMEKLMNS